MMDALIAGLLALAVIACLSWVWRNLRAALGDEVDELEAAWHRPDEERDQ